MTKILLSLIFKWQLQNFQYCIWEIWEILLDLDMKEVDYKHIFVWFHVFKLINIYIYMSHSLPTRPPQSSWWWTQKTNWFSSKSTFLFRLFSCISTVFSLYSIYRQDKRLLHCWLRRLHSQDTLICIMPFSY